ncbi:hypothetical protein QCA50_013322 [Cerrena zonata]|uniref:Uncharacterized protein n=1 Tax=Cerrena zonata TaxID=2478898 RepID=A0AAW0FQZ0_9APHY
MDLQRAPWKSLFRRRTASNAKQPPSLNDLEKQFKDAEDERSSLFESFLRQLEYDFLQAESARKLPEKQREEEFVAAQTRRPRKEDIFRRNEDRRTLLFQEVQEVRKGLFSESLVRYDKQSERFLSTIESLYSSGRQRRDQVAQRLVETITREFLDFLRSTHDAFLKAHFQRVEVMKKEWRAKSHATSMASELGSERESQYLLYPPLPPVKPLTPSHASSRQPSMLFPRSRSRSRSPRSRVLQRPVLIHSNHLLSPLPPSPHGPSGMPGPPLNMDHDESDTSRPFLPYLRDLLDFYDSSFHDKETQRTEMCYNALQTHESTFLHAEDERGNAVKSFNSRYQHAQDSFKQQCESSRNSFNEFFRKREEDRDNAEWRREDAFRTELDLFRVTSQQVQASFSSRARVLEVAETQAATSLKDHISDIISAMKQTIRSSRRAKAFLFSQSLRIDSHEPEAPPTPSASSEALSAPVSPVEIPTVIMPVPPSIRQGVHRPPGYSQPPSIIVPTVVHRSYESRSRSRSPSRRGQDSNFVPRMLFQANGLMPELPVPHHEHPTTPQMKDTSVVDAYLKMHRIIFTKEQERRNTKANEALQRWQQTFAINECKRQEEFKTQQMQYAEEADERGTEQSLTFLADQQQRAKNFLAGQSQRGKYVRREGQETIATVLYFLTSMES